MFYSWFSVTPFFLILMDIIYPLINCFFLYLRFSNESGFVSMGNARCSEISYSSFNSTTAHQKTSLSFIDSTPTPGDMPLSIMSDFANDMSLKLPSPPGKTLGISMANVVQQSMKQVSTSSSSNFFEQNSSATKMIGSNGKLSQAFSSSTIKEAEQRTETSSMKIESSSMQSFSSKSSQRNVSQTVMMGGNLSSMKNIMSTQSNLMENGSEGMDCPLSLMPPALPVKTRKPKVGSQCDSLNESGLCSLNSTMDDQSIEYRLVMFWRYFNYIHFQD